MPKRKVQRESGASGKLLGMKEQAHEGMRETHHRKISLSVGLRTSINGCGEEKSDTTIRVE